MLRKYGTGTGADLYIPIIKAGSMDFAVGGDWTPAAGDVKVSKDGGAQANIGTLPAYTNGAWKFVFTDAELTCAFLAVMVVDVAGAAVEDQAILVETYGNASAQHAFDLDLAEQAVALSAQGKADVNAEADSALADYDPPTKAELDSGLAALNDPTVGAIADQVWDEPRADHKGVDSFGRGAQVQHAAQATGGGSNYITLAGGMPYMGSVVLIVSGTGAGQARVMTFYMAGRGYVYPDWVTDPDATSDFVILPSGPAIMQAFGTAPAEGLVDVLLRRPISSVESAPAAAWQTLYGLAASVVNRHGRSGADIVIYETDGVTPLKTLTGVEDPSQVPVKSLTP
jgi:hypothetical protein